MTLKVITDDEWRWGSPDHEPVRDPEGWFRAITRHPSAQSQTHSATCFQWHPACAYAVGAAQVDAARDIAARLEQELAEVTSRCLALCHEWTRTGSMLHAAQLAEVLETGAP